MESSSHQDRHYSLAWNPDLVNSLKGREQLNTKELVVKVEGSELQKFLDTDGPDKYLVSGARGMGKSLALAYKVAKLKESGTSHMLPDAFPFMYRLTSKKRVDLSAQQLYELKSPKQWWDIWLVCLGTFIAASIARDRHQTLSAQEHAFPWATKLVEAANELVRADARVEPFTALLNKAIPLSGNDLRKFFDDHLLEVLGTRQENITICVDGIDEAIGYVDERGSHHSLFTSQKDKVTIIEGVQEQREEREVHFGNLARDAWIAAQQGYAGAAANITAQVTGIRVLGSLRSEAKADLVKSFDDVDAKWQMIRDLSTGDEAFAEIFKTNIDRSNHMAKPEAADMIERFAGVASIPSKVVAGQEEALLDYLRRHCFNTPRGLVQLGGAIHEMVRNGAMKSTEDQISGIIVAVNTCADKIVLEEHLSQQLPQLSPQVLALCRDRLEHNILSQAELARLNDLYKETFPQDGRSLSEQLYEAGLLGVPKEIAREWKQFFIRSGTAITKDEWSTHKATLLNASFAVIHPAFSARLCRESGREKQDFYRTNFIVGDGLPCPALFFPGAICVKERVRAMNHKELYATFEGPDDKPVELPLNRNHVAYCFLFSLILALSRSEEPSVTSQDLIQAAKDLAAAGYMNKSYGRPTSFLPHVYLRIQLPKLDPDRVQDYLGIRTLKMLFKEYLGSEWHIHVMDEGYANGNMCFSLAYSLDNSQHNPANKQEIEFRVVVPSVA